MFSDDCRAIFRLYPDIKNSIVFYSYTGSLLAQSMPVATADLDINVIRFLPGCFFFQSLKNQVRTHGKAGSFLAYKNRIFLNFFIHFFRNIFSTFLGFIFPCTWFPTVMFGASAQTPIQATVSSVYSISA